MNEAWIMLRRCFKTGVVAAEATKWSGPKNEPSLYFGGYVIPPGPGVRLSSAAFSLLSLLLAAGCATSSVPPLTAPAARVPAEAFMTHRAVLTARGREFALTGYLAISEQRGMRLVVSENFGQQLADVLVKPDGTVRVMKAGPMLKTKWIEKYVAADLKCLFGKTVKPCPVTIITPDHFLLKRRWYQLDLRIVQTNPGAQPAALFEEKVAPGPARP